MISVRGRTMLTVSTQGGRGLALTTVKPLVQNLIKEVRLGER